MACKIFVILLYVPFYVHCESSKEFIQITEFFFSNLTEKYESGFLTDETKVLIDREIDDFLDNTLKYIHAPRHKKQIPKQATGKLGVEVFDSLKEIITINTTEIHDLHFFKKHEQSFKVVITSTDLIVYQIYDTQTFPITYHPILDSSKLHVCKFIGTTWFIVKHTYGFTVFHFFQRDGQFIIQKVQSIDISDIKHFSVWCDQMQMFLSVSSASDFYVYTWLDGSFRLIESLSVTTNSSAFFAIDKSLLHLVILQSRKTAILKYIPNKQRFVAIQSISKSFNGATTMQISNNASRDYFLVLSNLQTSILYKLSDSVFIPFQEIAPADQIVSIVKNTTMVLFLVRNDTLIVHQYDGWRFIQLNYRLDGIDILKSLTWRGQEHLIVKKIKGNWALARLNWWRSKSPNEYSEDLRQWCLAAKDKAKTIPRFMTERKRIEVSNANLPKVIVDNVNGISQEKLNKLNDSYTELFSRFQAANDLLTQKRSLKNTHFSTFQAKSVHVKCPGRCHVNNLITELPFDITSKLRRINNETLSLKFEKVHVDTLEGFPCPKIGLKLEDVHVKGLINGISFDDLYENALRISGDQVVTGNHVFDELHVDSLIAPNIEAASTYTRQRFRTKAIYAKDLNLVEGGLLLPLDGEPVAMTGTLTAKKVTFNKLIDQHGGITGKSVKKFARAVFFSDYHELTGNYTLNNVKVANLLVAKDIARQSGGKTLKEIADNAIPLSGNVPVHLTFSRDRTVWSNITVSNLPRNWLTRKNPQMVRVTGKKIALKNITLPDSIYSELPLPKIETPICAHVAFIPDLRTSSIQVGRATAKTVIADDVEGAQDLDALMNDCVTSLNEVDLSKKVFTGPVFIENLELASFEGSIFENFETSNFKWYEPQVLKGPISLKNLNVTLLNATEGIKVPLPSEIGSLSVEGNFQVKTINGIDLDDFMKNVVRINESIELKNVKFEGTVEAGDISTTNTNINLQTVGSHVSLGNKTIIGNLQIDGDFSIPSNNAYPPAGEVTTYIIDGSVRFKKEPEVVNINGKNLQQLMTSVWMLNRPTNLTGNVYMSNVTFSKPFDSYHLLNTPNLGPWATIESRVLSKTKLQEIPSTLYFKNAKCPNIITFGNSVLNSSDPYLNDLLYMTLKKNVNHTISDKWRFEELIVTGDLILDGKINNLNLSTDVARHDVKVNVVTGKKTVKGLEVGHLHGLNFGEWAKDALMQSGNEEPVIITGKKTFDILRARKLKVNGTVMGKRIENCLTKYGDQIITAPKVISGSLHTRSLFVKGYINDMNFTDVALNQLTKNASLCTVKSDVTFNGNLQVIGDLTMKRLQGVDMQNITSIDGDFTPLINAIARLKPYAAAIEAVNKNRAKYWHRFEEMPSHVLLPMNEHASSVRLTLHRLGDCILISVSDLECNGHDRYYLKSFINTTKVLLNELLSVENVPIVVQVSSGLRSRITIFQYDYPTNTFSVTISIRVPGIIDASVLNHRGVVWIVVLLNSEMLVLRYETWGDLLQYHLPSSLNFVLDRVPATDETILVRDDGMWKLEGLAGPRHVFKVELNSAKMETFHYGKEFLVRLSYRNQQTRWSALDLSMHLDLDRICACASTAWVTARLKILKPYRSNLVDQR